jgi:hypothetical protein
VSEREQEESGEAPYGAGVAPDDLEAPRPAEERPDQAAVEAEERRRSTIARLNEPPQPQPA